MRNRTPNIILILGTLILIGILALVLLPKPKTQNPQLLNPQFLMNRNSGSYAEYWTSSEEGWKAVKTPPICPAPQEFASITDVSQATSVLYPGQMRSVGYENTAGFRFDGLSNDAVSVIIPIDGEVVQAARFLVEGELQYVFDILSPCGIMVRFDHLLTITPKFQEIADKLPEPKENDNRSTFLSPPVKVIKGETIATAVGLRNNTFISWTMFDFNKKNTISQDPTWASNHPVMDHYAICPFPYTPSQDQEKIKSLPAADSMSGNKSDFCE